MWEAMAQESDKDKWNLIVSSVLNDWPTQRVSSENSIQKKLKEVRVLTQQWDEAKKEAMGVQNV